MSSRWGWTAMAFAFVLLAAGAAHAAECRFDRTLSVNGEGSLNAGTGSGDLKVVPGDGAHVHISGYVKSSNGWFGGGDQGDVQRICDHPPIVQAGSQIKVGQTNNPDWFRHVSVDYTIEVPRSFSVTASTGSGDVEVHDIGGLVVGTSGSGDVMASNLMSGAKLQSGSGKITAMAIAGNAQLGSGSGDIHATFTRSGDVRATTGSGAIRLENVAGGLIAHTGSGDLEASGRPAASWQIGTGSGGVKLHIPSGSGFTLDAQASSGDIETSLPLTMQGSINKHHVRGTISGGGPEVRVETGSGDIRVD